jgi:hypothetical protein
MDAVLESLSSALNYVRGGGNEDPPLTSDEGLEAYVTYARERFAALVVKTEQTRASWSSYLASSQMGTYYRVFMMFTSVFSLFHYISRTYLNVRQDRMVIEVYDILEWYLGILFACDWSLNWFLADRKWQYCQRYSSCCQLVASVDRNPSRFFSPSFFSIIDICTVISIFSCWDRVRPAQEEINSISSFLLYILFGIKTVRILRPLRMRQFIEQGISDEVDRFIGVMSMTLTIFVLFGTFSWLLAIVE